MDIKQNVRVVGNVSVGGTFSATTFDENTIRNIKSALESEFIEKFFPIGTIYLQYGGSATPPAMFGGTWEKMEDTFLFGASATAQEGSQGGSATHTLSVSQLPSHSHESPNGENFIVYSDGSGSPPSGTTNANVYYRVDTNAGNRTALEGGDEPFPIIPPYTAVSIWRRIA